MSRARTPIAFDVLTPFGTRFRITPDKVAEMVAGKELHTRQCDDGTVAVRSWWETRETFYMPVYRQRSAAA